MLHPNDLSVPFLGLELRDHLQVTSDLTVSIDEDIMAVWNYVQDTEAQVRLGRVTLRPEELLEIQQETDDLVERFMKRCHSIKRESKHERRERRATGETAEPERLDDWLECDNHDAVSVRA